MHYYEWNKHIVEWLIIGITFTLSLMLETVLIFGFYWYILYNSHYFVTPKSSNYSGDDPTPICPEGSHCTPWYDLNAQFWVFMTTLNLVELMPFYAFLVKNTIYPAHDCFTCFNKDPERRYSIYQYTNDEWNQMIFNQKPEELRKSEARALTQILEREESFHNIPTELRSSST